MHETCLIIIHDPGMRPGPECPGYNKLTKMASGVGYLINMFNIFYSALIFVCLTHNKP